MEAFLPTEVARLVYGYLKEEECDAAAQKFLETSKYLKECLMVSNKGRRFHTRVLGRNLMEILDLLSEVICLVKSEAEKCCDSGQIYLVKQLKKMLEIDESEKSVPGVPKNANTVYLSISMPSHDLTPRKKVSKPPTPAKSTPEKETGDDALFDLTMLDTLLSNTALHERLAENINKAMSNGESITEKREETKEIIQTILSNTEADPLFDELVCDLIAPRDENSTPEDTEPEGSELMVDENDQDISATTADITLEIQEKEREVEKQNNEAVLGILASSRQEAQSEGETVKDGSQLEETVSRSLSVEVAAAKPDELENIVMTSVSFQEPSIPVDNPHDSIAIFKKNEVVERRKSLLEEAMEGVGMTDSPLKESPQRSSTPLSQAMMAQQCTLLHVLSPLQQSMPLLIQNTPSLQLISHPSPNENPDSRIISLENPQQIPKNCRPILAKPKEGTLESHPKMPPSNYRPLLPKPKEVTLDNPPEMPSTDYGSELANPNEGPLEGSIRKVQRSGVRTRGGLRRGLKCVPLVVALKPKIKCIGNDRAEIEMVETDVKTLIKEKTKPRPKRKVKSTKEKKNVKVMTRIQNRDDKKIGETEEEAAMVNKGGGSEEVTKDKPEDGTSDKTSEVVREPLVQEEKDETPENKIPTEQIKKRSLSTPRRTHVRVLDFKTPEKDGLRVRKTQSSPKNYPKGRVSSIGWVRSVESIRRGKLFRSPLGKKDGKEKSKQWDSDLRSYFSKTAASTETTKKSSSGAQKKTLSPVAEKPETKQIESPEKPENDCVNSLDSLGEKTNEDIMKHIRNEVMDVIGDEVSLGLSNSPCKPSSLQKSPIIIMEETIKATVVKGSPTKPVFIKPNEASKPTLIKDTLKTPAKLDFVGVLPQTPMSLLTPISKIIREETNLLGTNKKLLTPGFPPTPQNIGSPDKNTCSPTTSLERTLVKEAMNIEQREKAVEIEQQEKAVEIKQQEKAVEIEQHEKAAEIEQHEKAVEIEQHKKALDIKQNENLSSKEPSDGQNREKDMELRNKKSTRKPSISPKSPKKQNVQKRGKQNWGGCGNKGKTNGRMKDVSESPEKTKLTSFLQTPDRKTSNADMESQLLIEKCLESAKLMLFSSGKPQAKTSTSPLASQKQKKHKKKYTPNSEKSPSGTFLSRENLKGIGDIKEGMKKEIENKKEIEIKVPSFDVVKARLKKVSSFDSSSNSDEDLILSSMTALKRKSGPQIRNIDEGEDSTDSFPRLHLSDSSVEGIKSVERKEPSISFRNNSEKNISNTKNRKKLLRSKTVGVKCLDRLGSCAPTKTLAKTSPKNLETPSSIAKTNAKIFLEKEKQIQMNKAKERNSIKESDPKIGPSLHLRRKKCINQEESKNNEGFFHTYSSSMNKSFQAVTDSPKEDYSYLNDYEEPCVILRQTGDTEKVVLSVTPLKNLFDLSPMESKKLRCKSQVDMESQRLGQKKCFNRFESSKRHLRHSTGNGKWPWVRESVERCVYVEKSGKRYWGPGSYLLSRKSGVRHMKRSGRREWSPERGRREKSVERMRRERTPEKVRSLERRRREKSLEMERRGGSSERGRRERSLERVRRERSLERERRERSPERGRRGRNVDRGRLEKSLVDEIGERSTERGRRERSLERESLERERKERSLEKGRRGRNIDRGRMEKSLVDEIGERSTERGRRERSSERERRDESSEREGKEISLERRRRERSKEMEFSRMKDDRGLDRKAGRRNNSEERNGAEISMEGRSKRESCIERRGWREDNERWNSSEVSLDRDREDEAMEIRERREWSLEKERRLLMERVTEQNDERERRYWGGTPEDRMRGSDLQRRSRIELDDRLNDDNRASTRKSSSQTVLDNSDSRGKSNSKPQLQRGGHTLKETSRSLLETNKQKEINKSEIDHAESTLAKRGVKRFLEDEREEGEISDCSNLDMETKLKEPLKKKRQLEADLQSLSSEEQTKLLKGLSRADLDNFLTMVHGKEK